MRWKKKQKSSSEWDKWFARYPVIIKGNYVWFEIVERQVNITDLLYSGAPSYKYREVV